VPEAVPEPEETPVVPEEQAQAELPLSSDDQPVVGDIGSPVDHGAVEPHHVTVEPGVDAAAEEPHVEHVPIKRKGGPRKR
jgi:ribonuclease E